jgi:hypothetical protein
MDRIATVEEVRDLYNRKLEAQEPFLRKMANLYSTYTYPVCIMKNGEIIDIYYEWQSKQAEDLYKELAVMRDYILNITV